MTTRQAIHTDLQSLPSSVNTSFIMRLVYLAFRLISQPTISQVSSTVRVGVKRCAEAKARRTLLLMQKLAAGTPRRCPYRVNSDGRWVCIKFRLTEMSY